MNVLSFVRSRLMRDRTSTGTVAALSAVVATGATVGVAVAGGSDASSFVNPFLVPLLLGVLLAVATADSLARPRVAEELGRLGWTRRERTFAFALERTAAIAIGVVPVAVVASVLDVSSSVRVAVWMLVGVAVTSFVGELGRSRVRSSSAPRRSALRVVGASVLCALGMLGAATMSTGVTNSSGMSLAIPAAIVLATVGGAALLPFIVGSLPARGWTRAAVRPLRRDRRRVRAAFVVILPCMLLMMLMSVFQPSFAARESDRLAARESTVVDDGGAVRANELWVAIPSSALATSSFDVSDEPSAPTPVQTLDAEAASIAAASEAAGAALPDAAIVDVEALEGGAGRWQVRPPEPNISPDAEDSLAQAIRLLTYRWHIDVVVATPELLAALDPSGALTVPEGGALVFDDEVVSDGVVPLALSSGDDVIALPATVIEGRNVGAFPMVIVGPETVAALGATTRPFGLFVAAPAPIPEGTAAIVSSASFVEVGTEVAEMTVHDAWTQFDQGSGVLTTPQDELPFVPSDLAEVWRLMIVGSLIAFAAVAAVVVGSMLDRGEEYEVLHRTGASQALRRSIAAVQAGVVLFVAALFSLGMVVWCTAVGFADYNGLEETALPVPWHIDAGIAALVVVGVPLVGAALAAAVAPQRRRSGGVVGGRLRPLRAHA